MECVRFPRLLLCAGFGHSPDDADADGGGKALSRRNRRISRNGQGASAGTNCRLYATGFCEQCVVRQLSLDFHYGIGYALVGFQGNPCGGGGACVGLRLLRRDQCDQKLYRFGAVYGDFSSGGAGGSGASGFRRHDRERFPLFQEQISGSFHCDCPLREAVLFSAVCFGFCGDV